MEESNGVDGWSLAAGDAVSQATSQFSNFHYRIPPPPFNTAASESLGIEGELYVDDNCIHMASQEKECSSPLSGGKSPSGVPHEIEENCACAESFNQEVIVKPVYDHFGVSNSDLDFTFSGELDSSAVDEIDTELLLVSVPSQESEETDSQKAEGASLPMEHYGINLFLEKQNQQACEDEAQKNYSAIAGKFQSSDYLQKPPSHTSQWKSRSCKGDREFSKACQVPLKPVNDIEPRNSSYVICPTHSSIKESTHKTALQDENIAVGPQFKNSAFDKNVSHPPELKYDKPSICSQATPHSPPLPKSGDELRKGSADLVGGHAVKGGWRCPRAGKKIPRSISKQRLLDSWLLRMPR